MQLMEVETGGGDGEVEKLAFDQLASMQPPAVAFCILD